MLARKCDARMRFPGGYGVIMPASLIYHIAARADWERALCDGAYVTSTRGVTLAEQGYIHASEAAQVAGVANAFYTGTGEDLVLLVIDPARVEAEIRYED